MAKVTAHSTLSPQKIRAMLIRGLKPGGINPGVKIEAVHGTKLFRVRVLARKFEKLGHSERQDLVWRVIEHELPIEDQLRISMILTLTPDELEGKYRRRAS
jgi:hypothetical protein